METHQAVDGSAINLEPARGIRAQRLIGEAFGSFPTGIAAVCATVDGKKTGLVASSLSVGVSFDPPMVLFSVQNRSKTWPVLRRADKIGISILSSAHNAAAYQMSSRKNDRFQGLDIHAMASSAAFFVIGAPAWFECIVRSEIPAGDHSIIVLEVDALRVDPMHEPLIYHNKKFRMLTS